MTQIRTKRGVAAIFEFGVWTLVRVFTVYFSKLKVQLLKVELDIKCESVEIAGAGLLGPLMKHASSSCSEIDSDIGSGV